MAVKNRAEVKVEVGNKITPTVTVAKHTSLLSDDLVESAVFKKDVGNNLIGVSGVVQLDFASVDSYTVTANGNITLEPLNLEQGQAAKVEVVKTDPTFTVDWTGVNGTIDGPEINFNNLIYTVVNTAGNIIAIRLNRQYGGSLGISDVSGITINVTAVSYLDWIINDNVLFVQGRIEFSAASAQPTGQFAIDGTRFGDFTRPNNAMYCGASGDVFAQMPLRATVLDDQTDYIVSFVRHDDSDIPQGSGYTMEFTFQTLVK